MSMIRPDSPSSSRRATRLLFVTLFAGLAGCGSCNSSDINPAAAVHQNFCIQYYQEGKLYEAKQRCELALEYTNGRYAEAWNGLGMIEYAAGRVDVARQHYKKAIEVAPQPFAEALNNMGVLDLDSGNTKSACDLFDQATEVDPGYTSARRNYGACLYQLKKYSEANDQFQRCVEIDPTFCECRQFLGMIDVQKNDVSAAKEDFMRMTEVCVDNADGWFNLGTAQLSAGEHEESINSFVTCLRYNSEYLECKRNLAAAYELVALEDGAYREFYKRIQQNPDDPDLHFKLGKVFESKKLYERALKEFVNTIQLDGSYVEAYYSSARMYDRLLQTEQTVLMCRNFVDRVRDEKFAEYRQWCIERVKELEYQ